MKSLINLPCTKAYVRTAFIRQISGRGQLPFVVPCYLVAVRVVLNSAPRIVILTEEGAMFDSVPPNAICFSVASEDIALRSVCRWDCLADSGEVVRFDFVKDWRVEWYRDGGRSGHYLFTLNFDANQAWSLIPEQAKMFHFVAGDDGNLHVVVNNEMRWLCAALDQPEKITVIPESNMRFFSCE